MQDVVLYWVECSEWRKAIMSLKEEDLKYFYNGAKENMVFWNNLGGEPNVKDLRVLDIGCGHGSLCIELASKGAKQVIGIDLNERLINFAKGNLSINYPHLKQNVSFFCKNLSNLDETGFDLIVSKDTFEHIIGLDTVIKEIKNKLTICGRVYIGFAPLYNSPFGDHGRLKIKLPWGHLIFPEVFLIERVNRDRTMKIRDVYELGLNKLALRDYKKLIFSSDLKVLLFSTNVCRSIKAKLFSAFSYIPFLREYFTHNLYCILQKR